jgi:hypothetical protein
MSRPHVRASLGRRALAVRRIGRGQLTSSRVGPSRALGGQQAEPEIEHAHVWSARLVSSSSVPMWGVVDPGSWVPLSSGGH